VGTIPAIGSNKSRICLSLLVALADNRFAPDLQSIAVVLDSGLVDRFGWLGVPALCTFLLVAGDSQSFFRACAAGFSLLRETGQHVVMTLAGAAVVHLLLWAVGLRLLGFYDSTPLALLLSLLSSLGWWGWLIGFAVLTVAVCSQLGMDGVRRHFDYRSSDLVCPVLAFREQHAARSLFAFATPLFAPLHHRLYGSTDCSGQWF
jgi:hypothetical protein